MPLMPMPPMPTKWIGPMSRGSFMRQTRSAPLPTKLGLARVSQDSAQVGQARPAMGRGGGGGWCGLTIAPTFSLTTPPPPDPPPQGGREHAAFVACRYVPKTSSRFQPRDPQHQLGAPVGGVERARG